MLLWKYKDKYRSNSLIPPLKLYNVLIVCSHESTENKKRIRKDAPWDLLGMIFL